MLSKGQGKTIGTYQLLLEAFEKEGRLEEAEALWIKLFEENLQCLPRAFFTRIISMYESSGEFEKLLDVFADMEELQVKPDAKTVKIVAHTYKKIGMPDKQEKVLKKYPAKAHQESVDVNETEHPDEEIAEEAMNGYPGEDTRDTSKVFIVQEPEDASNSPVVASF
ncbi:hypothetical protein O6H91_Y346300 [Diphasiastrum complanatum]|nr:hypothetical protein O6H91_Y346300 [Diphasiastrum complanatum]